MLILQIEENQLFHFYEIFKVLKESQFKSKSIYVGGENYSSIYDFKINK